jgi:hypothetical protein
MKHENNWFLKMLKDHDGEPSSKRLVGVISAICLLFCLIYNCIKPDNAPKEYLVDAIALLSFGCLGLTATEKIFSIVKTRKNNLTEEPKKEDDKKSKTESTEKQNSNSDADANSDANGENGSEVSQ